MNDRVNFDREKLVRFKKAYAAAVRTGNQQFTFEGREVVVGYAKYMIEYLEMQFGIAK